MFDTAMASALFTAQICKQRWRRPSAEAFQLYEQRRLRRANREVTMSRQAARGVQLESPLLCALRDGLVSLLPRRLIERMQDATLAADPLS